MNNGKRQPWYGLDDFGEEVLSAASGMHEDPKPKPGDNTQQRQDNAMDNPEGSLDKDPEQPWVQDNADRQHPRDTEIGVNEVHDHENGDPPIDNWAQPEEPPKGTPHAR